MLLTIQAENTLLGEETNSQKWNTFYVPDNVWAA